MPKPIPIETYQCPICEKIIYGTETQAQEHVDLPVDTPLPKGFVYRYEPYGKDDDERYFHIVIGSLGITKEHSHDLEIKSFYQISKYSTEGYSASCINQNSFDLKSALKEEGGMYSLITLESFENFERFKKRFEDEKKELGIDHFIRTTPELEELILAA